MAIDFWVSGASWAESLTSEKTNRAMSIEVLAEVRVSAINPLLLVFQLARFSVGEKWSRTVELPIVNVWVGRSPFLRLNCFFSHINLNSV